MKVTNINSKIIDGYIRASADVIWEQAKKKPLNFFVEAPEEYESALETIRTYDMIYNDFQVDFYEEIMPALENRGRTDLVNVLKSVLDDYKQKKLIAS